MSPIRVAQLAEGSGWAGIEVHVLNLIRGFAGKGVDVVYVGIESGRLLDEVRNAGTTVVTLERRQIGGLRAFHALTRALRAHQPDVLHMHGYLAVLFGIPASVMAGVRTRVVTLHASPALTADGGRRLRTMLWVKNRLIAATRARAIAVSHEVRSGHLEGVGLDPDRIEVVHNGIDVEEIRRRPSPERTALGLPDGPFLIGMVGRIDENKAHIDVLRAMESLVADDHDVHLVVIGDGPERPRLETYCSERGLAERVSFLGFQLDAAPCMARLDALVIASQSEGIPYTLLEAMALGVPVVSTAVGGIPEVIRDEIGGLHVPSGDPDAIARQITRLAENRVLRARLATTALADLRSTFSHLRMAERTLEVYRHAARRSPNE